MILSAELSAISARVHPLRDRLLVQRFEYKNPLLAVVGVQLQKGLVVAVGYGRRVRRKVRFNHAMSQLNTERALFFEDGAETGKVLPMKVQVGDVVEFSPRNQIEWEIEGVPLVWVWQNACYGTTNDSQAEAMLWQQSAGYDRKGNFMSGAEQWQR